jgi:hypothetical protein
MLCLRRRDGIWTAIRAARTSVYINRGRFVLAFPAALTPPPTRRARHVTNGRRVPDPFGLRANRDSWPCLLGALGRPVRAGVFVCNA